MNRTPTVLLLRLALITFAILGISFVLTAGRNGKVESKTEAAPDSAATFTWKMPVRFGPKRLDGIVDFHWTNDRKYEGLYVNPSFWRVEFDACLPDTAPSGDYAWQVEGVNVANPDSKSCKFFYDFSKQGTYAVKLIRTAEDGTQTTFESPVMVKDLLIVSIGDSFASGQGNPDIPKTKTTAAQWIDRPCFRSAKSGPAMAAQRIEEADPHTSVTFLSFACSGATIDAGILGPQGSNKPQIEALAEALDKRPIDALVISIGGNDIGFSKLVTFCIVYSHFDTRAKAEKVPDVIENLGESYKKLRASLASLPPVKKVFITEYPDLVRDETGGLCDGRPQGDRFLKRISASESGWASASVIAALNSKIQKVAKEYDWGYVSGISDAFRTHGYCADDSNRWVRTFGDAKAIQGKDGKCNFGIVLSVDHMKACLISSGAVHPATEGHENGYAPALVQALYKEGVVPVPPKPNVSD